MTDFFFRRNDIFPVDTAVGAYDGLDVIAPEGRPPPAGLVDTATMTSEGLTFTGLAESGRYWAVAEVDSAYRWMGFWTAPSQEIAVGPEGPDGPQGPAGLDEGMVFNVKNPDYGAVGDGSTNDTGAIQNTIDAASAVNGTVFFPQGTYVISQITLPDNARLTGSGMGRTILEANSTACAVLNADIVNGNDGIEVLDLTINGNNVVTDFVARIIASGGTGANHRYENVEIKNGDFAGLQFWNMSRVTVQGCYIHDNSLDGLQFANGSDLLVQGCRIVDNLDDAIGFLGGDAPIERATAVGNVLGDLAGGDTHGGVVFAGVHGGTATGNTIRAGFSGVTVCNHNDNTSEDITVVGNTLERPGLSHPSGGTGIEILGGVTRGGTADAGVKGVVVSGNTLRSPRSVGIAVHSAVAAGPVDDVVISDNAIDFEAGESLTTAFGISVANVDATTLVNNVTISGNSIKNSPSVGLFVIDQGGTITRITIDGNTILNSGINTANPGIFVLNGINYIIANNRSTDTRSGGSKTQTYGITFVNGTNVHLSNNDFSGNLTGGISGWPLSGPSEINVRDFGATGDGSTDDTAAIEAAIAAAVVNGGIVFAPPGIYNFAGQITIPQSVSLQGAGAAWGVIQGTIFKGTDSAAQLYFVNSTSINQGFTIDGDDVANNPARIDESFGVTFIGVNVVSAAEDNLVLYDAQQATLYSCNLDGAARDNLVVDGSTQSCLFSRLESNSAGRHSIYLGDDDGVFGQGGGYNRFDQVLCEQLTAGVSDDPVLKIERCGAGGITLFDSCSFVSNGGSATSVAEVNETSSYGVAALEFRSCRFQEHVSSRVGLLVDSANIHVGVSITGLTQFLGVLTGGVKAVTDDTVRLYGDLQANLTTPGPVVDAASAKVRICSAHFQTPSTDNYNASTGWGVDPDLAADGSIFLDTDTGKLSWRDPNDSTVKALSP